MNRTAVIIVCTSLVLIASLTLVTILTLKHDDSTDVMILFTTGVLPTVMSMFAFHQASGAKAQATKAVNNTNGILHSVIDKAEAAGIDVLKPDVHAVINRVEKIAGNSPSLPKNYRRPM